VYLCISLCWKKVFMMHSVLLQHSHNRSLPLSFKLASLCRPITPFHTSASFPTRGLKSPKRIVHSLVLTLRRAQLIFSTNFRYSALEFGLYACIKYRDRLNNFNLNMHTLLVGSIHQHRSPAESLQVYPLKPGQTMLVQRRTRRVSTHCPAQQC